MSIEEPDLNKMKEEFEKKSKDEKRRIFNKDQLEAQVVDSAIDNKVTAFDALIDRLDQIIQPDQKKETHVFSQKEINNATKSVEYKPRIIAKSIKDILFSLSDSSDLLAKKFNVNDTHRINIPKLDWVTDKDIDYIAFCFNVHKYMSPLNKELKIDIIPDGSNVKTPNKFIINKLALVFEKQEEGKFVPKIEITRLKQKQK